MGQKNTSRVVILFTFIILSICVLTPSLVSFGAADGEGDSLPKWYTDIFSQKVRLGLDLQGGIHLQYKVQVDTALARKATQVAGTIEERLSDEAKVKAVATPRTGTTADELTTIDVRFENEADAEKLDPKFVRSFLPDYAIVSRNGAESTLQM